MDNYFTIPGRLDGLNEYTEAQRRNRYLGAKMKKDNEAHVMLGINQGLRIGYLRYVDRYPAKLRIRWFEPNQKRDFDNITFAVKFILDALVHAKVLVNDNQPHVNKVDHEVYVDRKNPRIEVEIIEGE